MALKRRAALCISSAGTMNASFTSLTFSMRCRLRCCPNSTRDSVVDDQYSSSSTLSLSTLDSGHTLNPLSTYGESDGK